MSRQIRQFTPDERMQALHRAEEVGATRAGKELGVARCTIHRWQREARRAAVTAQPRPAEPRGTGTTPPLAMRFRAQVGLAMYQCRLNDPGDVVHCCRKDTLRLRAESKSNQGPSQSPRRRPGSSRRPLRSRNSQPEASQWPGSTHPRSAPGLWSSPPPRA